MRRKGRIVVPALADMGAAALILAVTQLIRRLPGDTATALVARLARAIGPVLARNRVGRENLRLAFPDMPEEMREAVLGRMWENFARGFVEFVHLEKTFDYDPGDPETGRVVVAGAEHFDRLRESGEPAIIFTAHLANWELLGVCAARFGLDVASLFRAPTNRFVAKELFRARSNVMGRLIASRPGASLELGAALEAGKIVGLLVDQRFHGGVTVPFFGRPADTNPLLAKLARRFDCPVHGARAVRLPDGRLRLEITDAVDLPRDADGHVDIVGATAAVQRVVESWVREYPDQWLWVHRRWRIGRKTRLPAARDRTPLTGGKENFET